jgi:hypothetical protein
VGAVIGIRAAGKTKKPPYALSLHSEPMGDGLRLRFRKYQSDFKHLLIQSGAGVALRSDSGTRRSGGWPAVTLNVVFDYGEKRARIGVLGLQIGQHYLAFVGVHDGTVSEIKPDGSTR